MAQPNYWTMLTPAGRAKVKNAIGTGLKINITKFAVGDGEILPNAEGLSNEVFRGLINSSVAVADAESLVEVVGIVPSSEGGFYVREAAFYTEDDEAFVIVKYPETFKPSIEANASAELGIKAVIDVVQSDVVNLKVDPSMVYATQSWVENEINKFVGLLSLDGGNFTDSFPNSSPIDGGVI
ncbi:phage tail protein [Thalassomonas viridans]|uniref:Phage tail protein n=1 Tax=Thalassomonas viridans TaxID=137584 RepID=A0AAE9Z173_9GAMM|nr:phage tail protein [Thalassomonas viridans]WDE04683.1 phage tail protein [Thalassomonas viridans]